MPYKSANKSVDNLARNAASFVCSTSHAEDRQTDTTTETLSDNKSRLQHAALRAKYLQEYGQTYRGLVFFASQYEMGYPV